MPTHISITATADDLIQMNLQASEKINPSDIKTFKERKENKKQKKYSP